MNLEQKLRELGYDPDQSPMAAAMIARMSNEVSEAHRRFVIDAARGEAERAIRALADVMSEEPAEEPDVEWGCCDNPRPRILEANGRLFCRSCLLYLDAKREDGGASDDS